MYQYFYTAQLKLAIDNEIYKPMLLSIGFNSVFEQCKTIKFINSVGSLTWIFKSSHMSIFMHVTTLFMHKNGPKTRYLYLKILKSCLLAILKGLTGLEHEKLGYVSQKVRLVCRKIYVRLTNFMFKHGF